MKPPAKSQGVQGGESIGYAIVSIVLQSCHVSLFVYFLIFRGEKRERRSPQRDGISNQTQANLSAS